MKHFTRIIGIILIAVIIGFSFASCKEECWDCNGNGRCGVCGGDGKVWSGGKEIKCPTCVQANGKCKWCNGTGKR